MKPKRLLGLLVILGLSVLTFTACSNDDDDEQTRTYEYQVCYSMFSGSLNSMNTVSNAFAQAFGVSSLPITLTGTQKECDRKAKEYAIKAEAALATEGSFSATVEFNNMTTDNTIHSFTINNDDNGVFQKNGFWYVTEYSAVIFKNLNGKRLKLTSPATGETVFDGTIDSDSQRIEIDRKKQGRNIIVVMEGGTRFSIRLTKTKD